MSATQAAPQTAAAAPLLSVNNIEVIYNHVILVLKGVSLAVPEGRHRGAAGRQRRRQVHDAEVDLQPAARRARRGHQGLDHLSTASASTSSSANELVRRGVIQVMEGRHCFGHLTVEENLLTGAFIHGGKRQQIADDLEQVYTYFPRLKQRRSEPGRLHLGRRAADVRHRPRADEPAQDDPARRAVDGPGAAAGRGDFRDRAGAEREGRRVLPGGRAEHQHGAALRPLRLHPGNRPHRARRRRPRSCAKTRT